MKKIGLITIHRIFNYGSVLQAYALQNICTSLGFAVEIIDYIYPNKSHRNNDYGKKLDTCELSRKDKCKSLLFKCLYALPLCLQHKRIRCFMYNKLNLSHNSYSSPEDLQLNIEKYDIYMTGSDQIWNPRYTGGDSSFFLPFVSKEVKKIAYSSSFGISDIPKNLYDKYAEMLSSFQYISVREKSGISLVNKIAGKDAQLVLDPTLLLNEKEWGQFISKRKIKEKYILCYFLNYTFNGYPYIDDLAEHLSNLTGYKLVKIARPPQKLINKNTQFEVSASPEDFISLIAHSELVLTTSFHGTAFALNFKRPMFSIVSNSANMDSRQRDLLKSVGLEHRLLEVGAKYPSLDNLKCDYTVASYKLDSLRESSLAFLKKALLS